MVVTFLAVASGATCAPLNPNYRSKEFGFFLSDLKAKALIIQSGIDSPARRIAEKRGDFPADPRIRIDPWRKFAAGSFDARVVPGEHLGIFKEPNVQVLAQQLSMRLEKVLAEDAC